ncbi:MAG: protein-disulfide reductase DsbD domain-containing protein [Fimbriimonadales bacterium]
MAVLALLGGACFADSQPKGVVKVDPIAAVTVQAGQRSPVTITIHIKAGYHIGANTSAARDLVTTHLEFNLPKGVTIGNIRYPAGKLTSFPFAPATKLSVYSGDVVVKAMVIANAGAVPSTRAVHAALIYQACDKNAAYAPKKLAVNFNVKITGVVGRGGGGRRK